MGAGQPVGLREKGEKKPFRKSNLFRQGEACSSIQPEKQLDPEVSGSLRQLEATGKRIRRGKESGSSEFPEQVPLQAGPTLRTVHRDLISRDCAEDNLRMLVGH